MSPAIVWQSRQSQPQVEALLTRGMGPAYQSKTGLVPDAYFTASKLAWLLEDEPDLRRRAEAGELLAGTVDSWLLWNLTGGAVHATDVSNASRTMLFDIQTLEWSAELLQDLAIPPQMLPRVVASAGVVGLAAPELFGAEIPVSGIAGDQQAALFGQTCFAPGEAKNTYGTGSFLLMNTGSRDEAIDPSAAFDRSPGGSTDQVDYALEGSVFISGAAVEWLRDGLGIIDSVQDVEPLAASVPDTGGVTVVPALTGLGAPHWDAAARGTILGPHPRLDGGPHRPRHARGNRVSNPRRHRRHDRRLGNSVDQLACRRRRGSQRSPDADPGRRPRRPGHPTARMSKQPRSAPRFSPDSAAACGPTKHRWQIDGPSTASSNPRSAKRSARAGTRSGDSPSIDPAAGRFSDPGSYCTIAGIQIAV